jgi:hypothetical protein
MSLRATYAVIASAEINAYYNYRTNIYLPALETVFYSNTSVGNNTELEKVAINNLEILERSSYVTARLRQNLESK